MEEVNLGGREGVTEVNLDKVVMGTGKAEHSLKSSPPRSRGIISQ